MAWENYYGNDKDETESENANEKNKFPFPENQKKTNLPKEYPNEIQTFVDAVKSELIVSDHK